ncbi:MAG: NAD(P)-dependent oxidoreductase [Leptolyngbyaceae cyanobacterium SM1_1_3]|nr:NAD(P)-dependent oxidoreductase [Leptolyngbyaceae cyanobacterium SM1_1_3]NJM85530.1 NAD(P)-dependent oxidoreductase [Leptolyngbyaceae cyanobacterium RM2_2_21]NJN01333.1 NAD(P)-dependent oxidoreductase [Leptolyngbyaceae cyanobacterium RM1_1_2]NJO09904.1 NAD(P)-dependent oxidoreductase [Leptolyngbyaceae cyanobacterium SL_1_1]
MKLLVTGASGFLGRAVVAAALQHGHQVAAMLRPKTDAARLDWHTHEAVSLVRLDLRQRRGLADAVSGCDAVVHLAAVKGGEFYEQFAGTIVATENLLAAMLEADVKRLVAISTFSVYDYLQLPQGALLDESAPIEDEPAHRDGYAQTKLIQEDLVHDFQQQHAGQVTVIRPGMVYGPDNLWNPCLGEEFGSRFLRVGASGCMPLTYVENCAEAIVLAAEKDEAVGQTINIVDDHLPSKKAFAEALLKQDPNPPKVTPVSWAFMQFLAGAAWFINQKLLKGQAKLPGLLVPAKLHGRFRPHRYSNQKAKQLLGWSPQVSLEEAISRSL